MKYFSIVISAFLVMFFPVFSSASNYSPYGSVTDSSSQVNILYDAYLNSDDFSFDNDFLIMRDAQSSYYLFYGDLTSSEVSYIRYYSDGSYSSQYLISYGIDNSFSYSLNNYTVVGTVPGSLALTDHYSNQQHGSLRTICLIFVIVFIFYVFRSTFKELIK